MVGVRERRWAWIASAVAVAAVALLASPLASALRSTPGPTKINDKHGRFIPIPDRVPHAPGAYIDKRIKRNLIWLADHFRIYVTELSWNHDDRYRKYEPSRWVEVFKVHKRTRKASARSAAALESPPPPAVALRGFEYERATR
jgi:hypothetical protein